MSKRLNPHRRLLAKQAALVREIVALHGPSNDDSGKLQQGVVKSSLSPKVHLTAYATPRDTWEGLGKRPRKSGQRFTVNGFTPDIVERKLDTKS